MKKREYSEDEIKEIKSEIEKGTAKSVLAKRYGTSYNSFKNRLIEWGIPLGKLTGGIGGRKRQYSVCDDWFEVIDTEEKAYWLGFLYADGYVTSGNKIGLSLATSDRSHVEKFKVAISAESPIKDYETQTSYGLAKYSRLLFTSKKMYDDLASHGLIERKTNTITFPTISIKDELVSHFIRGYFDGDGSMSGLKKETYAIKICGTESILRSIEKFFPIKNKERVLYERKEGQVVKSLDISGSKQVIDCINYLYNNATVYLDRKYLKTRLVLSELSE